MAVVQKKPLQDEQNKPGQTQLSTAPTAAATTQAQPNTVQQPAPQRQGTGFTNLQRYLDKNQGRTQALAGKVSQSVQQQSQRQNQANQQARQDYLNQYKQLDSNLANKVYQTPEQLTDSDKQSLLAFRNQSPQDVTRTQGYGQAGQQANRSQMAVNDAIQQSVGTAKSSWGTGALDRSLIAADRNAASQVDAANQQLQQSLQGFRDLTGEQLSNQMNQQRAQGNQAWSNLMANLGRTEFDTNQARANQEYEWSLASDRYKKGLATDEDFRTLGLTREQAMDKYGYLSYDPIDNRDAYNTTSGFRDWSYDQLSADEKQRQAALQALEEMLGEDFQYSDPQSYIANPDAAPRLAVSRFR